MFSRKAPVILVCLVLLGLRSMRAQAQDGLVAWWPANGNYNDIVGGHDGIPHGEVSFVPGKYGAAFDFDGSTGRIFVADSPDFELTTSLAISAWIWIRAFPPAPDNTGMVLFRGDDRGGLDPYFLADYADGTLEFYIQDANNNQVAVAAPVPAQKFVYVVAILNNDTGHMLLYEDGKLVGITRTTIRPFANLDPNYNPGLGIGDVQSPFYYADYFDGLIDDVKLYNTANPIVTPAGMIIKPETVEVIS